MTTGYTAKLVEKGQTFPEFIMTCAKAFGACIELRDESLDTPIPKKFEKSSYHVDALNTAKKDLVNIKAKSKEERLALGRELKDKSIRAGENYIAKTKLENDRIYEMIGRVIKWEPPTADHIGLKKFMLEQLKTSLNDLDYSTKDLAKKKAKRPIDFYNNYVKGLEWQVKYHTEQEEKEVSSNVGRNQWLIDLRTSISKV
jgi:hypothetical protein